MSGLAFSSFTFSVAASQIVYCVHYSTKSNAANYRHVEWRT